MLLAELHDPDKSQQGDRVMMVKQIRYLANLKLSIS